MLYEASESKNKSPGAGFRYPDLITGIESGQVDLDLFFFRAGDAKAKGKRCVGMEGGAVVLSESVGVRTLLLLGDAGRERKVPWRWMRMDEVYSGRVRNE
jgi:hypothetical protein